MLTRQRVALKDIRLDALQGRVEVHQEYVDSYMELYENGVKMPDPVLFVDHLHNHWIGDGWHRIYAQLELKKTHLMCEIRSGSKDDALLFNIKSNNQHRGIPLTRGDKRHSILQMLGNRLSKNWTDTRIAEYVGCSRVQVCQIRNSLIEAGKKFANVREDSNGRLIATRQSKPTTAAARATKQIKKESVSRTKKLERLIVSSKTKQCPTCGGFGTVPC